MLAVQVPVLTPLTPAQKAQLCPVLRPISAPAGTTLVRRGELGDAFYIVQAGCCVIFGEDGKVWHLPRIALRCSHRAPVTFSRSNAIIGLDTGDAVLVYVLARVTAHRCITVHGSALHLHEQQCR